MTILLYPGSVLGAFLEGSYLVYLPRKYTEDILKAAQTTSINFSQYEGMVILFKISTKLNYLLCHGEPSYLVKEPHVFHLCPQSHS